MEQFDDLPDPPGPSDPFNDDPAMHGGGYLAGNDDQEIRKIRRRVSPLGKVTITIAWCSGSSGASGTSSRRAPLAEQQAEQATNEGMHALEHLLGQDIPRDQMASRVRDLYQRYGASERVRMSCRRILARLRDTKAMPLLIEGMHRTGNERHQAAMASRRSGCPKAPRRATR